MQKNGFLNDEVDDFSSMNTQNVEDMEEEMRARAMQKPSLKIPIEILSRPESTQGSDTNRSSVRRKKPRHELFEMGKGKKGKKGAQVSRRNYYDEGE